MNPRASSQPALLLYEPRTEGHHLAWLRLIAGDLLGAGFRLTLAVDRRPGAENHLHDHLGDLLAQVPLFNAYDASGRRHADGRANSVAYCLEQTGTENVFLGSFDEIASSCWRRAAVGILPPARLRGRMGGIYHRPRFLAAPRWSPNQWLKKTGFRRLLRDGWLRQLLFLDEYLARDCRSEFPNAPISFLPDPCPENFSGDAQDARRLLEVPSDRRVFLFFGTGARRKGLHLAVAAFQELPPTEPAFLLCVGQQSPGNQTADGLKQLEAQGRARFINRYVTVAEEKLSFAACDMVLLPYVGHFGISAVLSQAMAASKPVIASDEQLMGRLVREHNAGLLFRSGDAAALRQAVQKALKAPDGERLRWKEAARQYTAQHSRAAFRAALLESFAPRPPDPKCLKT
jgi:glycosyltransferase involved in cell wall biosynthesis